MEPLSIRIDGKEYPCRITMGAMRRFKKLSGKEVTDIDLKSMADTAELLYCCVASACNADKVPFTLSCDDFCDALEPQDFERLSKVLTSEEGGEGEEKKSV